MTIEFNKVAEQVYRMGSMIEKLDFDLNDRLSLAIERFRAANDLDAIQQRIEWVRKSDISGYRGAAPLDAPYTQPVNAIHPAPAQMPAAATIIAADGSQIYPDEAARVHYYLLNIGIYIYHHGAEHLPQQITHPTLAFHKDHVHDPYKRLISNRTVDARRTVTEMKTLAEHAWELRRQNQPIIALYDNNLLFWADKDVTHNDQIMRDYHAALVQLHDVSANGARVTLAGYVDNPHRSRVMLRLLYLLSLKDEAEVKARERELAEGGDLEGLRDRHLFQVVLKPGERSAIMVQNSPRNLAYRQRGVSYEIAFFYLKVGAGDRTSIARVDIPMWVARDPVAVDELHAILLAQCTMQGRNPYPYALTRADELAYVSGKDKAKLDELINIELRRHGLTPLAGSAKTRGKELARSDRTGYELRTDLK